MDQEKKSISVDKNSKAASSWATENQELYWGLMGKKSKSESDIFDIFHKEGFYDSWPTVIYQT